MGQLYQMSYGGIISKRKHNMHRNNKCSLCRHETINHNIGECRKLALQEYKQGMTEW